MEHRFVPKIGPLACHEVNVVENGAIISASPAHGEGPSTALLAAIQEGFVQMSGNMANAITEAFKSFRADLEIMTEEDLLNSDHKGEPPHEEEARRCKRHHQEQHRCRCVCRPVDRQALYYL